MVQQLGRDVVNVQAPQFDLQGYLGMGGNGGVGSGGRVSPMQFAGVSPGSINMDMGGGGRRGGGYEQPQQQPGFMDFFGAGLGQSLAKGIPEKVAEFQMEQKRKTSLSAIDKALQGIDRNDPQSVMDSILHSGADPTTMQEVASSYAAGQNMQNQRMAKLAPQMKQQAAEQGAERFGNAMEQAYGIEPEQQQMQQPVQNQPSPEEMSMQQQQMMQKEARDIEMQPSATPAMPKTPAQSFVTSRKLPSDESFVKSLRGLSPAEVKVAVTARKDAKKMAYDEVQDSFNVTKEYRDTIDGRYKAALATDHTLQEMQNIVQSGELSSPIKVWAVELLGMPISFLGNPADEVFQKHSETLMKGVGETYRGQLKQVELESYAKTLPRLVNSDEAKLEVIKQKLLDNESAKLEYQLSDAEILMNGTVPPKNLQEIVTKKLAPELKKMYEGSRQDLEGPVMMILPGREAEGPIPIKRDMVEKALKMQAVIVHE